MEGWLSIPEKKNKKRYEWKKQYVCVSSKKIFFYNSEQDKATSKASTRTLDIRYVGNILKANSSFSVMPQQYLDQTGERVWFIEISFCSGICS